MKQSLTRRMAMKVIALGTSFLGLARKSQAAHKSNLSSMEPSLVGSWNNTHDRIWLGKEFWANPMEDWRIVDGSAECQTIEGDRNIHLITHQLTKPDRSFEMTVRISRIEVEQLDGGAGFRIGIRSDINEFRSNCFAQGGLNAGLVDGKMILGHQEKKLHGTEDMADFMLTMSGRPSGENYELTLTATSLVSHETISSITQQVSAQTILGNVALVSNFDSSSETDRGARYKFSDWSVAGDAFTVVTGQTFGPILWSMYTLSDSRGEDGFVLKMSALTGPLGENDNKDIELLAKRAGRWTSLGTASLDPDAWTATFRIPNWDENTTTPYKLVYRETHLDNTITESEWNGTIRSNPVGRPVRIGVLTCQKDYAFPYAPVANNLLKLDPDMLYFSGDQLYEDHGGYGMIREPAERAILNYLRKFYMFGWAFREPMRSCPTVCIPDDHDVFQGNIWGEGGAKMAPGSVDSKGGYREPARMVNAVHKTCAGHHPDYYDPTPCEQNISVYYGDMVYGRVSFAILGDRQFKSGPERVDSRSNRADHVTDLNFDTSVLDKPGLVLLGERQEKFLKHWVEDWRGHEMKVLLSQTVFAGVATHHGNYNNYVKGDLDSGGWPQTPRDQAIRIIRQGMPLHINGDQHLTSLVQYGVDQQRDGCWSFCTPAIAVGYPRWWRPDEVGMSHENRPTHGLPNTGEYLDGFGNKVYVYAVGNWKIGNPKNRYDRAHQKGSGFGFVTIDTKDKTYLLESFRFLVDATDGKTSNQFPGWPVTLKQAENRGENALD